MKRNAKSLIPVKQNMEDPDWAKLLNYLYENQEPIEYSHEEPLTQSDDVVRYLDMEPDRLTELLTEMQYQSLVKCQSVTTVDGVRKQNYSLSTRGFDVAHEREITKSQQKTNRRSARLSGYLVVAIILQSLIAITQHEGGLEVILLSMIILALIFAVLTELQEDYLSSLVDKARSRF